MDGSLTRGVLVWRDAQMNPDTAHPIRSGHIFLDAHSANAGAAAEEAQPHQFADQPSGAPLTLRVSEPREGQQFVDLGNDDTLVTYVDDASGQAHVDLRRANAAGDHSADLKVSDLQMDGVGDASGQPRLEIQKAPAAGEPIASALRTAAPDPILPKRSRRKAGDQQSATSPLTAPNVPLSQTSEGDFPLATLIELWRQRQDLTRARQRIDLQCQAICRRLCAGDKGEAAKLWKGIQAEPTPVFVPYLAAIAPLDDMAAALEKPIRKLGKQHPLWEAFAKEVRGFGELRFAGIIAEAGRPISDYRGPAALWSRFRLGVEDGKRQILGASPARGALVWNLGGELLKSQGKEENAGPYRTIYDRRKAYLVEMERAHPHASAARYMVKAVMKDLWRAARDLKGETHD